MENNPKKELEKEIAREIDGRLKGSILEKGGIDEDARIQWLNAFADNSDPSDHNRGIILFARTCFPDIVYEEIPYLHEELYRDLLQMYNPVYRFAQERQTQITMFRGAAKSSISSFIFPTYVTCMNGMKIKIADWDRDSKRLKSLDGIEVEIREDVIVIVSETGAMAENWIVQIRGSIASNRMIKYVFGNLKQQSVKDDEGKWTRSAFTIVKHSLPEEWQRGKGLTLVGKGVNMQQRGLNIRGRPTLIIMDDLYSLNNTKTPEGRAKVRYIVDAEIGNSIDPKRGKIISMGTVVHEDTVIVDFENSNFWHTIKYPIMEKVLFDEVLNKYCTINRDKGYMKYPDRYKCKELESRGYKTAWASRWTLEMLLARYAEKVEKRTESMFWQEMFHIVLAEEDKYIRRDMIRWAEIELVEKNIGGHWHSFVKLSNLNGEKDKVEYRHVNLGLGIDAAISYKTTADNSAILLIGMDYYGRIYFIKNRHGKFGISDEMKIEYQNTYVNRLCLVPSHIQRIGSGDEIFRWVYGTHHRPKFIIETNSIGNEVYRQVKTKMSNYGMRYMILEVLQTTNKEERILDTLQPYYQERVAYHNTLDNQEQLVYELEFLGKAKRDDNADVAATIVSQLNRPTSLVQWDSKVIASSPVYKRPDWLGKAYDGSNRQWRTK